MQPTTLLLATLLTLTATATPFFPVVKPWLGGSSAPATADSPANTLTARANIPNAPAAPKTELTAEEAAVLKWFTCSYLCQVSGDKKCDCGQRVKGASLGDVMKALQNAKIVIKEV
ncbi:hypothetical protein ACJQWK_06774 [Exserohilum turcicum]|uniref:Uncharacterized protein n=1 Tax=Exserohilum turcicum (strain 28A) TaxID=671987 RepID=R0JU70_EXST2|nr:uncharacterized protein SETTUDRAFT_20111 [Exserohilum turcica Et28A]EOA84573.1 hypothetical protein SETTUDRAFT_20111 [Exserohilum turcica Et28A]